MQDPVSGRDYKTTVSGLQRWAAKELPYGVPLLYAIVGFVAIATIASVALAVIEFALNWSAPVWTPIAVLCLGVFWAFGGWQHGVKAEAQLDVDAEPRLHTSQN